MSTKHTLGPWRWSFDFQTSQGERTWSLLGKNGFGILSCDGEPNSPQEVNPADARLIAAAPELLEALHECIGVVEGLEQKAGIWRVIGDKARAAIAKATGEQA